MLRLVLFKADVLRRDVYAWLKCLSTLIEARNNKQQNVQREHYAFVIFCNINKSIWNDNDVKHHLRL